MSGLSRLNARLQYQGGNAEGRFDKDKLSSLKKALLYSYQAETIILSDNREFRCLLNPDKETGDYDNKIISIPYKDINLVDQRKGTYIQGIEDSDLKCGDVFTWKRTNSHWIVYMPYPEEESYFRAQVRRCDEEIEVGNSSYWVYVRGPVETQIQWAQKSGIEWNTGNYSLVLYITKDDNTTSYLKRFAKVKVGGKTWQVAAVNTYWGEGIIQVQLEEYFENSIEEAVEKEKEEAAEAAAKKATKVKKNVPRIEGPTSVTAYSTVTYSIKNSSNGEWFLIFDEEEISGGTDTSISFDINMKQGQFNIEYRLDDEAVASLEVSIDSV